MYTYAITPHCEIIILPVAKYLNIAHTQPYSIDSSNVGDFKNQMQKIKDKHLSVV